MTRYEPLTRYLSAQRDAEVLMSFKEIETVLGRSLPPSARKHQAWWANSASHSYADSWLRIGRRTERLDLAKQQITFVQAVPRAFGVSEEGPAFRHASVRTGLIIKAGALYGATWRLIEERAAKDGVSIDEAAAALLNDIHLEQRQRLIDEISARPKGSMGTSSVELIREDRDER